MEHPVIASLTLMHQMACCAVWELHIVIKDDAKLKITNVPRYLEKVLFFLMYLYYLKFGFLYMMKYISHHSDVELGSQAQ